MSSTAAFIEDAPMPRSFNDVWKPIMHKNEIFFFKIKIKNCIYENILYCPETALFFWEVIEQSQFLNRYAKINDTKSCLNPNKLQHILVEKQPKFSNLLKHETQNSEGTSYVLLNAIYEIDESKFLNFEWHLKRMTWAEFQVNIFQSILLMMVNQVDQMICLREELILREAQLAQYKKSETTTEDNRNHKTSRRFSFDSLDSFFFKRNQCASGVLYISHYFISPQITIKQIKRNPDYTNEIPTGRPQTQAVMQLAMALKIIARYQRSLDRSKKKMSYEPTIKCTGDIPCEVRGMRGFIDSPSDHHQYSLSLFGLDCNCRCLVCPSLRNGLLKDGSKFVGTDPRHTCSCQCAKCIIWRMDLAKKEEDGYMSEFEDYDSNLEPGSVSNLEQQDWLYELAVMYSSKNARDSPEVTMARQRIAANKKMSMEMANNEASYQNMQMKKYNKTIKKQLNTDLPLQIENNLKIEKYYDKLIKYLPTDDQKISIKSGDDLLETEKCNHASSNRPMLSLDSLATPMSSEITQQLSLQKYCQNFVKQDFCRSNLTPVMTCSTVLESSPRKPRNLTKFDHIFEFEIQKPEAKRTQNIKDGNKPHGCECSEKCKAKDNKKCYYNDRK